MFIGVDLGTTFSTVGLMDANGRPDLVADSTTKLIPSQVWFKADGTVAVGTPAARQRAANRIVLRDVKRIRGMGYDDAAKIWKGSVPLEDDGSGVDGKCGRPVLVVNGEKLAPAAIEALILRHLIGLAEKHANLPIICAVITVPANFNMAQMYATRQIAELAGLKECHLVTEPTAAAVAYTNSKKLKGRVGVFDMGGGTTDFSDLDAHPKGWSVMMTTGLKTLGGRDFTHNLAESLAEQARDSSVTAMLTEEDMLEIEDKAEQIKQLLTDDTVVEETLKLSIGHKPVTVTREQYEELIEKDVDRAITLIASEMAKMEIVPAEYKAVLLAGGASKTPLLKAKMRVLFDREPLMANNVDETVGIGAVECAWLIYSGAAKDKVLADVTPSAIGIEIADKDDKDKTINHHIIAKNSTYPCMPEAQDFVTVDKDKDGVAGDILQGDSTDPKECAVIGSISYKLPPKKQNKKGVPIKVRYVMDSRGRLLVIITSGKDQLVHETFTMSQFCLKSNEMEECKAWVKGKIPLALGDLPEAEQRAMLDLPVEDEGAGDGVELEIDENDGEELLGETGSEPKKSQRKRPSLETNSGSAKKAVGSRNDATHGNGRGAESSTSGQQQQRGEPRRVRKTAQ